MFCELINSAVHFLFSSPSCHSTLLLIHSNPLQYCDGTSFTSDLAEPATYNGTELYFRGFRNLQAVITDLLANHGLDRATDVIVGGDSAGGLATWIHTDYFASRIPPTARIVGLPDSGRES